MDPKRLKKGLQKIIKSIGPEDRILVLGTSRSPFETDMKSLVTTFNKIIVISKPDHASRFGKLCVIYPNFSNSFIINTLLFILWSFKFCGVKC